MPLLDRARSLGLRVCLEPHPKQLFYNRRTTTRWRCSVAGDRLAAVHAKDLQVWRRPGWPTAARQVLEGLVPVVPAEGRTW